VLFRFEVQEGWGHKASTFAGGEEAVKWEAPQDNPSVVNGHAITGVARSGRASESGKD
jgi:hypothetical protein